MGADMGTVHLLLQLLNPAAAPAPLLGEPGAPAEEGAADKKQGAGKEKEEGAKEEKEEEEAVSLDEVEEHWNAAGLLHVQLIKCLNLPSMDDDSGRNDAFCVISGGCRVVGCVSVPEPSAFAQSDTSRRHWLRD